MTRPVAYTIGAFLVFTMLVAAGPTLVSLVDAAVPLVIATGMVIAVLRLVWYFTGRY